MFRRPILVSSVQQSLDLVAYDSAEHDVHTYVLIMSWPLRYTLGMTAV